MRLKLILSVALGRLQQNIYILVVFIPDISFV